MLTCEAMLEGLNESGMSDSGELMYGLHERLPFMVKSQFV